MSKLSFFKRLKFDPLRYLSLNYYYRKRMEPTKFPSRVIFWTIVFKSIDFKYTKIRHNQKRCVKMS
jgi:hypothetical protein